MNQTSLYADCRGIVADLESAVLKSTWDMLRERQLSVDKALEVIRPSIEEANVLFRTPPVYDAKEWDAPGLRLYIAAKLGLL